MPSFINNFNALSSENMPTFRYPEHYHPPTTTIKSILSTLTEQQTESVPETTESIINAITTQTSNLFITPNETANAINEVLQNNNTAVNLNNTVLNDMIGANNSVVMVTNASTDGTGLMTDVITTTMESLVTSTQNVINTASNTLMQTIATEQTTETAHYPTKYSMESETMYIILVVILVVLIFITAILFFIYKKVKSQNARSGVYCVTDLNEISVSSTTSNRNYLNKKC